MTGFENPLSKFKSTPIILDGGLASELETTHKKDLSGPLWSAKILKEDPTAIKQVHKSYLEAGADLITTSSYQASLPSFLKSGYTPQESTELIHLSVHLSNLARSEYTSKNPLKSPLILGSLGPYGAYLSNGSEYTGIYPPTLTKTNLQTFHTPTSTLLISQKIDILLFESIPSLLESLALTHLITQPIYEKTPVIISFTCKSPTQVSSGDRLLDCITPLTRCENVVGIGINCTDPRYVTDLIKILTPIKEFGKKVVCYPSRGDWDNDSKSWVDGCGIAATDEDWLDLVKEWVKAGADVVGGCCRVGPEIIKKVVEMRDEGKFV